MNRTRIRSNGKLNLQLRKFNALDFLALRKFAETGKQTDGRTKRNKDILKTDKKRKTAA